uniref:Secreted protein n=1 Tax=Globodera pallida TaxID=36090 RepID=A0A183C8I9_GLOPA
MSQPGLALAAAAFAGVASENWLEDGPPNTNRFKTKRMLLTVFSSAQPSAVSQMPCGADKGQQIQDEQHQLLQLSAPYSELTTIYPSPARRRIPK